MSEKYTLLLCSILDSSVWREDSDTKVVWVTLLAMADEEGYIGASVGGVAHRAHVSREAAESAIEKFLGPDPDSRCPDHDGARLLKVDRGWRLANYAKLREIIAEERERQRKAEWARQQRRAKTRVDDSSEAGTKSSGSDHDQIKEEDPPTPKRKPRDPFGSTFTELRADVLRVHAAYREAFGLANHKLKNAADYNAQILADAIDAQGEDACLLVLKYAPQDGMVSGREDDGKRHESIRYIFDNPDTFARILRAAQEREGKGRRGRPAAVVHAEAISEHGGK